MAGENELYRYDFSGQQPVEGSIPVGGKPRLEPGPYRAALREFKDYFNDKGNRTIHVQMVVDGGPEDGTRIDEYFSLTVRNGKKSRGWLQLQQFFLAMNVRAATGDMGVQEQETIEDKLYSKKCVMWLRDSEEDETPRLDEGGEQIFKSDGTPEMWAARVVSRIDYFESLKKAEPKPQPAAQTAPPAEPEPEEEPEEEEASPPAPPPIRAQTPARPPTRPAAPPARNGAAAPRRAPPAQPIAAAATADENDDVWGDE